MLSTVMIFSNVSFIFGLENNDRDFYDINNLGWQKEMYTGWLFDRQDYYYLDSKGVMKTGWVYVYSYYSYQYEYYYCGSDGRLRAGWKSMGGKTYFFLPKNLSGHPLGAMVMGYWTIDGVYHKFDNSGALIW